VGLRHCAKRDDAEFDLVDVADFNLPLLDESMPAMFAQYSHHHTRAWSAKIASFDGYVFVMPEYNHGACAALKNAIDFLYQEWTNKAALANPSPWSLTLKNAISDWLSWRAVPNCPLLFLS
jgi:NAD(P)H-dependent FMN reductase